MHADLTGSALTIVQVNEKAIKGAPVLLSYLGETNAVFARYNFGRGNRHLNCNGGETICDDEVRSWKTVQGSRG